MIADLDPPLARGVEPHLALDEPRGRKVELRGVRGMDQLSEAVEDTVFEAIGRRL